MESPTPVAEFDGQSDAPAQLLDLPVEGPRQAFDNCEISTRQDRTEATDGG